uniref:Endonuclease/exonuclease/phosphatase domain-containing protein n=1 Tax=Neobodo designis TaxID=312471 RepID=A0A7S1PS45_NEODS|mmetsp:Transcript_16065/g.49791  ORF Transcript_16065/g.49791 Transcript_16065/m.49791 type:complete len:378 (+) Transcript_16065:41-1174(+)
MEPVSNLTVRRWDGAAWSTAVPEPEAATPPAPPASLRLATLNILADCFPWFVKLATPPAERIAAAVECIAQCDADVLGLNEVTPGILATLLADARVRAAYRTTHVPEDISAAGAKHACVVLSKVPLAGAWHFPAISEAVVDKNQEPVKFGQQRLPVVVRLADSGIEVAAIHTMAYQRGETRRLRAEQIAHIVAALRTRGRPFAVMGDMNLHDAAEDACVVANDMLDVWAETHPTGVRAGAPGYDEAAAGYTFDAQVNTMIRHYIPGETRRMRLDRILVSRGFPLRPAGPCRLWADEPVDAKRDIFVSDHFGLVVDMAPCNGDSDAEDAQWQGDANVRALLEANARSEAGAHKVGKLRFGMSLVGHSAWLAKRSLGFA